MRVLFWCLKLGNQLSSNVGMNKSFIRRCSSYLVYYQGIFYSICSLVFINSLDARWDDMDIGRFDVYVKTRRPAIVYLGHLVSRLEIQYLAPKHYHTVC